MRTKYGLLATLLLVVLIGAAAIHFGAGTQASISLDDAVTAIERQHPELSSYPSTTFPVKRIQSEPGAGGINVAFITEGSGRPIVEAHCYFVGDDGTVLETGAFLPAMQTRSTFSIRTCSYTR
mgnify:CR=1 FL=1